MQCVDLTARYQALRDAYDVDPVPPYERRMEWLGALLRMLQSNRARIAAAVSRDFGSRSMHETQIAEVFTVCSSIRYVQKRLRSWMRPQRRDVRLTARPGFARVHYQPLGVVGIISPWNYPFQLAIAPLVPALSAGNRVMIKPSERTPCTAALLQELLAEALPADVCSVVVGGPQLGAEFSRLPFGHLLFTGSVAIGREVMRAAAENLTPVTLELGGKSPALVHPDYPVQRAVARIAAGKWFNAGQTCVAPDYLLVAESKVDEYVRELTRRISQLYPRLEHNADYTALVDAAHLRQLQGLIDDARQSGARVVQINPAHETLAAESRKLAPTLLLDVRDDMRVMREEIFGPVLPIIGYRSLPEAIRYVNRHARPLALYYFDSDRKRIAHVLDQTVSGGATVNDTLLHCAIDDLPFGGVGHSGMGAYHGFEGFATFSHGRGVFYQSMLNGASAMDPPFTARAGRLLDYLIGKAPR